MSELLTTEFEKCQFAADLKKEAEIINNSKK
jgi:hypothetical protein